ncbi:unnamed protein product [Schistosoma curassoni]|uniref:Late endosomal/lysosomal adaptor and MAPK and MTOR activator 5 n=1 Tax=Schistosoma curassoni TaxID=6186 RepID=A0A183KRP1_9TREM|nr:unnamed protein product [Schistosoma curassoni]
MLHNHPCSSSWMVCDPWTRSLSSEEKENSKPVILHCESADEVIESIKERTGKQVTAADIKGMKATLSTESCSEGTAMKLLTSGTNLTYVSPQGHVLQQALYETTL